MIYKSNFDAIRRNAIESLLTLPTEPCRKYFGTKCSSKQKLYRITLFLYLLPKKPQGRFACARALLRCEAVLGSVLVMERVNRVNSAGKVDVSCLT